MVEIHLSDEEKLEVFLLALGFFLISLLLSICLALSYCPLNRWLIERHARRKNQRQRQQQQQFQQQIPINQRQYNRRNQQQHFGSANLILGAHQFGYRAKGTGCQNYSGPPPAYEAALRATRLQSLTGSLPPLIGEDGKPIGDSLEWLQQQHQQHQQQSIPETQLDFGDYFHQPKELSPDPMFAPNVYIPMSDSDPTGQKGVPGRQLDRRQQYRPPVMLRLWVKMMEPGELVARARKAREPEEELHENRRTITRQLSIPQLFGSLVNLASGRMTGSDTNEVHIDSNATTDDNTHLNVAPGGEMNSILSTTSSGSSNDNNEENKHQATIEMSQQQNQQQANGENAPERNKTEQHKPETSERKINSQPVRQFRALSASGSITSRVLHMNVASFSYVKDESLISTKKHNQMNYQHFCSSIPNKAAAVAPVTGSVSKLCQLMISICDVENMLNSSWIDERPCALLAPTSSVYVQCEILTAKSSKSARILRYPLRALNGSEQSKTHTLDFASTIPAAAVERPPIIHAYGQNLLAPNLPVVSPMDTPTPDCSLSSTTDATTTTTTENSLPSSGNDNNQTGKIVSTNWRHEPNADGKSIVVFNSVPKQIAQSQPEVRGAPLSDLIQFDSVFVSPILSKSIIEDGYVRFRFYSQCKYVNESCLAELKLPLRQLLQSETRDNLGDAHVSGSGAMSQQHHQHQQQAELILDNLLANLVTASNGSPLSSLIEQISAEEREQELEESGDKQTDDSSASSSFRLPWNMSSNSDNKRSINIRSSFSFSDSLNKIGDQHQVAAFEDEAELERVREMEAAQEHERRIEKNYCRSLLVSHWLNYLAAPAYECQLMEESRGKLILGLTYLPTSNRVIFNAHRAIIDDDSYSTAGGAQGKQIMKNLRLQSSTSYLLRFLMVTNGRVVKRKQTPVSRRPEWDSQEAITFDLVSVSVDQPNFLVALVVRNVALGSGSLQNLRQNCCGCGQSSTTITTANSDGFNTSQQQQRRPVIQVQSDPESLVNRNSSSTTTGNSFHETHCTFYRYNGGRDLVIGHLVLGEQIWREMRAQPRKQIVKQFKIY